jgi:hypothetical protein
MRFLREQQCVCVCVCVFLKHVLHILTEKCFLTKTQGLYW